jgi:ATP-dependent RNA helicase SUPV3L1/SUV3
LGPEFHLRADRFYNSPDTEIDFTEQGGLMWGEHAVGKLVAGSDPLKPRAEAFVEEEAGAEIVEKVSRRLQHFIDRKINTLFEPLIALSKDEALQGLARGFAFRMVEALGVIPRDAVAGEVKELDQDARGALRKHGIRFGQFTIFMPLLLKPAPTRLRLVLWSLARDLSEFPESPPPGLVTVPVAQGMPDGYHAMAGYRPAGDRAIRIDMLERLADMLRAEDSRGGFEAKADMLSITGMTLEQFASLMEGLGYSAERGEREKVRAVDTAMPEAGTADVGTPVMDADAPEGAITQTPEAPEAADIPAAVAAIPDDGVAPLAEEPVTKVETAEVPEVAAEEVPTGTAPDAAVDEATTEVFYTFRWQGNRQRRDRPQGQRRDGGKPRGKGKPKGKGPKGDGGPRNFAAKPARKDRIDPDNPFAAALMGLKSKE